MPVWQSAPAQNGYWDARAVLGNDEWREGQIAYGGANRWGGIRFTSAALPQGSRVLSATLTGDAFHPLYEGNRFDLAAFLVDDLAQLVTGKQYELPTTEETAASGTTYPFTIDVAGLVQQVIDRPGWAEGNALGFLVTPIDNVGITDLLLTVEWEPNVQMLDVAARLAVPATVGGTLEVESAVTPTGLHVPATVGGPLDIIAPRRISVDQLTVPTTVGVPAMAGTGSAPPLDAAATLEVPARLGGVPLLSITLPPVPPPIPWERLIVDDAYAEALASRQPVTDARVEVISPSGAVLATLGGQDATHPGVVAGSVTCDGGAAIRWTCDLTIDNPDLLPRASTDLLHPLAHNRLRIWWRILLGDGTWGEIPVGTYYPDWPSVSDDGHATIGLSVRGSDAAAEIKRATYETSVDVGGMYASDAIRKIITDRAPWAPLAITPSTHRLPAEFEAGEPGGDPWDDITKIASAAGMEVFADRMGVITVQPLPSGAAPARAAFEEGPECAMTELSAEVDLDQVANTVTVVARASDDTELIGRARDNDPTSPLWIGHGYLYHRRVQADEITTQAQADQYATQLLDEYRSLVDQVELVAFARPHLNPGDVVTVVRDRAGVTGPRRVTGWSLGLGDLSGMRITTTGRRGLT